MDTAPDYQHIIDLMLGRQVVVEYMGGPHATDENEELLYAKEALTGQPEARTRLVWLTGYSSFGIEVEVEDDNNEDNQAIFISWGAVLRIHGYSRAQLERDAKERDAKEAADQTSTVEDSDEASPT
jgi:hypothetical protein